MAAASPDGRDTGLDETTLADDDWPVYELYRVDPAEPEARHRDTEPSMRTTAVAPRPVRRYPFRERRVAGTARRPGTVVTIRVARLS